MVDRRPKLRPASKKSVPGRNGEYLGAACDEGNTRTFTKRSEPVHARSGRAKDTGRGISPAVQRRPQGPEFEVSSVQPVENWGRALIHPSMCENRALGTRDLGETATPASGPRPFLQILSCAPRPVRVRCRFPCT
eukprot:gene25816-biopygen16527